MQTAQSKLDCGCVITVTIGPPSVVVSTAGQKGKQTLDINLAWCPMHKHANATMKACRAHHAWSLAEKDSEVSFSARMELCNYAQWLTEAALFGLGSDYAGVPHLVLIGGDVSLSRESVEGCERLIEEMFAKATAKREVPQ
jgi:hypothetical protein